MDHVEREPDDQAPLVEEGQAVPLPEPSDLVAQPVEALVAAVAVPLSGFDTTATPVVPGVTSTPPKPTTAERLAAWHDEFWAWVKTLASAAVYATLIVTFGFQVARVEGLSMAPTLDDQDRLIVNKLVYRLSSPRRSDIVMLYYPVNPDKSFVKRVIAKENDTVRIVDGKVYVNGEARDDVFVPPTYRSHEDHPSITVKQGYYFVMGDHRNNSSDSREWGEVPRKYIIGKVQLRWWPLSTARIFY